jgi:hypothetical protein
MEPAKRLCGHTLLVIEHNPQSGARKCRATQTRATRQIRSSMRLVQLERIKAPGRINLPMERKDSSVPTTPDRNAGGLPIFSGKPSIPACAGMTNCCSKRSGNVCPEFPFAPAISRHKYDYQAGIQVHGH